MSDINKVAVFGSGVMGSGIAAQVANDAKFRSYYAQSDVPTKACDF